MWHEGGVDSVEIVKKWKSDPSSIGCKQCESSMHICKHSDLFDAYWLLSKNKLLRKINPPTQFVEKDQIVKSPPSQSTKSSLCDHKIKYKMKQWLY